MAKNDAVFNTFLSSLIQDIKSYSGTDPLLPWLRGIKKMKETLPSDILKEKLPRFLQKCSRTFQFDRRYKNDMRYLRVWLQLMDFVDDPRVLLRTMEENHIGVTRSLFYQAYALYYEKMKKFEDAEKMYHLGVQNLAEPADELQKSYELYLHRMERHKKKKIQLQERRTSGWPLSSRSNPLHSNEGKENCENICRATKSQHEGSSSAMLPDDSNVGTKNILKKTSQNVKPLVEPNHIKNSATTFCIGFCSTKKDHVGSTVSVSEQQVNSKRESNEPIMFRGEDTMVVRFVDTAIVGKSEIEDACHHGLVDPTINMKEAMNAINNMFREPLDTAPVGRRSGRSQKEEDRSFDNGFNVFIDENLDSRGGSLERKEKKCVSQPRHNSTQICEPHQEPFKIFVDDEESDQIEDKNDEEENLEEKEIQNLTWGSSSSSRHLNGFVFPNPKDIPSESSDDLDSESSPPVKLREDTVVHRFVGSTILDEPEVENVCHHGLVDPTINLKEAMNDINNMFGKPIDFVRAKRPKKQEKVPVRNQYPSGFSILPDDDLETKHQAPRKSSSKSSDSDLFEPTVFTKEAMDDINKLFGMPLDF